MSSDSPKIKYPYRRYWPTPPIIQSFYQYQDVNADKRLQTDVIEFFYKKVLSWIDSKEKFLKFKNFNNLKNGKKIIYKILKQIIKKTNINWYDLRDNYILIKKYIYIKLNKYYKFFI